MSIEAYDREIKYIKSELKKYRPDSILQCALSHLHFAQGLKNPAEGMPWFALFILKLAMLEGHRDGKVMRDAEFNSLAQKLLDMQILACPIRPGDPGVFGLKVRAMVLQQFGYQRDVVLEMKSIVRQITWFVDGDGFYSAEFECRYGMSLNDFYSIATFLVVIYGEKAKGIVGLNLHEVIFWLCPAVPLQSVFRFFALVGVRSQDLPEFFERYRIKDELNQQSEYFQPSPLRYRPVLIDGQNFFMLCGQLFSRGLSSIVPYLLKKDLREGFKNRFGPDMECYVGKVIESSRLSFLDEKGIKKRLARFGMQAGKTTDYLVDGDVGLVIECKAIEPGDIVSSVFDPAVIKNHLNGSFLKAVDQIQDTVSRLKKTGDTRKYFGLVVTHEDFWFVSAADVESMVAGSLGKRLRSKFGELPVDLSRILFIQIEDFECLIALQDAGEIDLFEFINECVQFLQGPGGMRFTMHLLVRELLGNKYRGHPLVTDKAEAWMDQLLKNMERNKSFWQGQQIQLMECRQTLLGAVQLVLEQEFKGGVVRS